MLYFHQEATAKTQHSNKQWFTKTTLEYWPRWEVLHPSLSLI